MIEAKLETGDPLYKVMGDVWVCPGCGHRAVLGLAGRTVEPFDDGYADFGLPIDVHVLVKGGTVMTGDRCDECGSEKIVGPCVHCGIFICAVCVGKHVCDPTADPTADEEEEPS